MKKIKQYNF